MASCKIQESKKKARHSKKMSDDLRDKVRHCTHGFTQCTHLLLDRNRGGGGNGFASNWGS